MSKQANRPRLGRGLNALLSLNDDPTPPVVSAPVAPGIPSSPQGTDAPSAAPATPVEPPPPSPFRSIPLDDISPNPHQPRKQWDETALADLAASLKTNGVIQPIIVRQVGAGYQLIAGERRFRAAKLAGLPDVPAIVREVDGYTQAQMALVENIHRTDLNPIERAIAYGELMQQLGLTQAELAARLGEQRSSVANYLRLLDLTPACRDLVAAGKLSLGHAKVLAGVSDPVLQQSLAERCVAQELSVRNLERLLETPEPTPTAAVPVVDSSAAHFRDLETNISRQLGLRVQLRPGAKKGKGRVVIHYTNLDQFDEFVKRLGVELE